jgi:hypothetical protein
MEADPDKIDEAVLALLYLTLHDERRAWKSFDRDVMNRLHKKGFISDPVGREVSGWDAKRPRSARRRAHECAVRVMAPLNMR